MNSVLIVGGSGNFGKAFARYVLDKGVPRVCIFSRGDLEATRFWMTLRQAVELVWNTALTMKGGELVIPELPASRLGDLLTAMNPCAIDHVITGLGAWEKAHESMTDGVPSDRARRMSVSELREALNYV